LFIASQVFGCAAAVNLPAPATQSSAALSSRACSGISAQDRETALFDRTHVERVSPLYEKVVQLKTNWSKLRGSRIDLRATPGMTRQWLTRLAQCQAAQYAETSAISHENPLAISGVVVSVHERSNGFSLLIRTDARDSALANRVLTASRKLLTDDSVASAYSAQNASARQEGLAQDARADVRH
jgi:hypothetical protein